MNSYDPNWIEQTLQKLKKENEMLIEENTRILRFEKINQYLANYNKEDRVVFSKEIEQELESRPLPKPSSTGFPEIDKILGGFYPSQHILLGARAKSGKTTMALEIIERLQKENPLFIPLEQDARELISIRKERGQSTPNFVVPKNNMKADIKWITERITEAVIKYNTKVVFIDHFEYIELVETRYRTRLDDIRATLQALRNIAKQLSITIVTMVHVRKGNIETIPTTDDIMGSAAFHQESDAVIMLWREVYRKSKNEYETTNKSLLAIQANRRFGNTGNIRLEYVNNSYRVNPDIIFKFEEKDDELRNAYENF